MTITTGVSLRAVAQDVFASSTNPNRYELIDEVLAQIDERDYEAYLRDALRMLVPTFAAAPRRVDLGRVLKGFDDSVIVRETGPRTEIRLDPITLEEKRVPVVNVKRELIRNDWQRFLANNLPIGGGKYVLLRDATVSDIRATAEARRVRADGLLSEAEKWDRVADVLASSGKERIGELAPDDLRVVQGEIAA